MIAMSVLLLIVLGLCLGSFANAFVIRLHAGRDWVKERSECLSCHHTLGVWDLIPVASWLYLRGRCRYCGKPIPDSPIVELSVPLLFIVSYISWPSPLDGIELLHFGFWLVFLVAFVALAVYDMRWLLLPDKIVFPLIGLAVLQVGVTNISTGDWRVAGVAAISAGLLSGLFFVLHQVSNGKWIGFGDVKLAIVLGLLAGTPLKAMLLLLVASAIGTVIALPMVVRGRAGRKTKLPFGPLLLAGTVVVVLWGQGSIDWYLGLLSVY